MLSLEQVTATLTDRNAYRIIYSLVNQQLDGVERALTVDVRRVVAVNTFGVERHRAASPFVDPDIRQLALAQDNGRVYLRMNLEEELGDRVTACRCLTVMTIRAGSGVGLSEEGVTVAFVDIYRNTYVVRLAHGQQEGHDTVASFRRTERLLVRTALSITNTVEQEV